MNKPDLKSYKHVSPFKLACITNFPFIEADFDAITNYELLSLIVKYLNDVIDETNTTSENVKALAEAFNKLLDDVNDAIEEQNARIDEYFSDINIQTFVDNKINEMIETDEFQELLEQAILDLDPSAFDKFKKVNVLDFGNDLIEDTARDTISQVFTSNSNKEVVLSILNEMLEKGKTRYYFVNASDEVLNNIYYIEMNSTDISNSRFSLVIIYDLANDYNISYNDSYIVRQYYDITISDNIITDYVTNLSKSTNTYKLLKTDNTVSFTPANSYEPATKDYVDTHSGGGSDAPIYYHQFNIQSFFNMETFTLSTTDKTALINIINDALSKNYKTFILVTTTWENYDNGIYKFKLADIDTTQQYSYAMYNRVLSTAEVADDIALSSNYGQNIHQFLRINVISDNNAIIDLTYSDIDGYVGRYLPVNNFTYYVPQNDYDPATKSYVDNDFEDYSNNLAIFSGTSASSDPIICYKKGKFVNLRGTIEVGGNVGLGGLDIQLPSQVWPNSNGNGNNYACCYTIGYLDHGSATPATTTPILCFISYNAGGSVCYLVFSSLDGSTINLTTGDFVSFNINYMIVS